MMVLGKEVIVDYERFVNFFWFAKNPNFPDHCFFFLPIFGVSFFSDDNSEDANRWGLSLMH